MALSLTTADSALKEDYQPAIREQLNNKFVLLAQIEKNTEDFEGRRAVLSLHVSRNSGVGPRLENGTLPTAGNQGYAEERINMRYQYGRIQLSGPVIEHMKSDKGSFTRAVDSETKGVVKDLKRSVNRQLFGTSDGVIAQCATTTASTTVNLTSPTTTQLRQLEVGMVIDIGTVASPTGVVSGRTIVSVGASSIVISGAAVTAAATDFIFESGTGGIDGGAGQKVLTGLQTIVDSSGTLFNVNPTTYPVWKSYEAGTVGTISDLKFEQAVDGIDVAGGDPEDLMILTTDGVRRAYSASLTAQKRFANTLDLKGGFKALSVSAGGGDIPLSWDRDCPTSTAFLLSRTHLQEFVLTDWGFMDKDGAVLSRVANTDAYEATLRKYHELGTDQRNAHGKMTGITEA